MRKNRSQQLFQNESIGFFHKGVIFSIFKHKMDTVGMKTERIEV